jgi:hypothetical protein
MSENPPSKHPLWDGCLQSVQQACHLKMWSLGMWWYLAFWNAGKGRRLWTILINATGRYVSTPNFCVWPCLPFKCNQFWHIHSDVFCVDEPHWHVCQEWKREGVQQASILWHSNCRITLLAFIRTCIMIRKSWNIFNNVWKWYMMCSLQNNTTSIHPPNLYYSKEVLKHFETKCTILTHLFNKF